MGFCHMKKWVLLFSIVAASGAGVYVYSPDTIKMLTALAETEKPVEKAAAEEATPVGVALAEAGVVTRYLNGLGNVVPRNSVVVKSRVDGQLMKIHFREGQVVRQGDLLAEIDSRQFEAQLKQAEGQYKRDSALLSEARVNLARFQQLATQGSIAAKQLDAQQSLVKQYEGATENNQGQIESARLQVQYTKITAPISGRVGLRQVDTGNIVHATDPNGIVTITELQPINVVFSIPEDDIALLKQRKAGEFVRVDAWDREAKKRLAVGILSAIDNQLDATTGTLKLKVLL
jgi:multidrug efflux system membrane fusion protein